MCILKLFSEIYEEGVEDFGVGWLDNSELKGSMIAGNILRVEHQHCIREIICAR